MAHNNCQSGCSAWSSNLTQLANRVDKPLLGVEQRIANRAQQRWITKGTETNTRWQAAFFDLLPGWGRGIGIRLLINLVARGSPTNKDNSITIGAWQFAGNTIFI